MKVVFGDVVLENVDDILTEEQVRSNLAGIYPSIANATCSITNENGEKVMTFTPKAAEKG